MERTKETSLQILQSIIQRRGLAYLREGNGKFFVNAFSEMGGDKQDVRLLRYLTEGGVHEDLLDAASLTPAMQRAYYSQAVQKLCNKSLISEELAHRVCGIFWQAVYQKDPPVIWEQPVPTLRETPDISGNKPEFDIVNGALLKYNGTAAKVTVPGGVTRIGPRAFIGSDAVRSVSLPYGLIGMGKEAFAGCRNLQEISIPGSVIAVHMDAFAGCRKLKKLTLESGVRKLIFGSHLNQLGSVAIRIPDTVTSVTWNSMPESHRGERMKCPKTIQASQSWVNSFQEFFRENPDFQPGKPRRFSEKKLALLGLAVILVLALISVVTGGDSGTRTRSDLKPYNLEDGIEDLLLAGTEEIYTYPDGTWMELYYDDTGKEICRIYVNQENDIENLFEARYDDAGRLVYHQSFDGEGNLLRCDSYDFHSSEDTAQRRITLGDGRNFLGQSTFDENGYETFSLNHQDGTWTVYVYKDGGVLTRRASYDAEGNPPEVSSDAMQIGIDWENVSKVYGPRQTVVGWTNDNGYTRSYVQGLCGGALKEYSVSADAAFIETYDPAGNLVEELYYGDGQMNDLVFHEVHTYDTLGNYTGYTETFYTSVGDGNYTVTVYDENGIRLSMESHFFEGEEESVSYYRYETELDDQDRQIQVRTFDGETGRLISVDETEYDWEGNVAETIRTYYHDDGDYNITVRDRDRKITSDITYYSSGSVQTENAYNSEGQNIKTTSYYENGQVQTVTEYSGTGETLSRKRYYENGTIQYLDEYDAQGNLTKSTSYYENGKTEFKWEYNSAGQEIRYTQYYENGSKRFVAEYDDQGQVVRSVYYNEDGTIAE